jgi:glutaminase
MIGHPLAEVREMKAAATNRKSLAQSVKPPTGTEGMQREQRLFWSLDDDNDGWIESDALRGALQAAGLRVSDSRLAEVFSALDAAGDRRLDLSTFGGIIAPASLLVERALQGNFAVPDFGHFQARIREVFDAVRENREGDQARYIPPLAEVDAEQFGISIVTVDGQQLQVGEADADFSIQSTCKPFNYAIALEDAGEEAVHQLIGREPSGQRFNAYVLNDGAQPHNPMINAGAILCCSLIRREMPLHRRFEHIREFWSRMTGGPAPRFNAFMSQEETRTGDRNRALAYMMKNEGIFPDGHDTEDHQVRSALELYFRACSLELNCLEMATAAATLANAGVCPLTLERVLSPRTVRNTLSLMHSCGMYDYSGEFAFTIGLPAKSGVGGAVVLVVPGIMGICVWSPRLDRVGNSVRGVDFAKRLSRIYALHMYDRVTLDTMSRDGERTDPRVPVMRWRARRVSGALWAASTADIRTVRRMLEERADLERGDYDLRTPMHLAAAEGHLGVISLLLDAGVSPNSRDRWGGTPLDDAESSGHDEIAAVLRASGATTGPGIHRSEDPAPTDAAAEYGDQEMVVELLWAAALGDLNVLRRCVAFGVPLHAADYDGRTALHLAAAEGHVDACRYLIAHAHPLGCRDRWGSTPLDEAVREERFEVVALLEAAAASAVPAS